MILMCTGGTGPVSMYAEDPIGFVISSGDEFPGFWGHKCCSFEVISEPLTHTETRRKYSRGPL